MDDRTKMDATDKNLASKELQLKEMVLERHRNKAHGHDFDESAKTAQIEQQKAQEPVQVMFDGYTAQRPKSVPCEQLTGIEDTSASPSARSNTATLAPTPTTASASSRSRCNSSCTCVEAVQGNAARDDDDTRAVWHAKDHLEQNEDGGPEHGGYASRLASTTSGCRPFQRF